MVCESYNKKNDNIMYLIKSRRFRIYAILGLLLKSNIGQCALICTFGFLISTRGIIRLVTLCPKTFLYDIFFIFFFTDFFRFSYL